MSRFKYTGTEPLSQVVGLDFTIIAPLIRHGIRSVDDLVASMEDIQQGEVRGIGDKRYAILVDWVKEYTKS